MVKQVKLKYFSTGNEVWCPTKEDFLVADVSKKDLPKIEDAYGKFVGFPTHDNFIQFVKTFFKFKTTKQAESEMNSLKPIMFGNPFVPDSNISLDLMLNACLIYLSLLNSNKKTPILIAQVLNDLFPLSNIIELKSFLETAFSSVLTLKQQIAVLKWLQPIIESKEFFILGPRKRFPSPSSSASTNQKYEYIGKWLNTLGSAKTSSAVPFSELFVTVKPLKSGKLYGQGDLKLSLPNQSPVVSVRFDQQAIHVLGFISLHELQNRKAYERTKVPMEVLQSYSEKHGLIQSDGVPFADSFNKVKGTINKKVVEAVKKEFPSKAKDMKNFLVSDNNMVWISTVSRPFFDRYDFLFQSRKSPTKRKRQKKMT